MIKLFKKLLGVIEEKEYTPDPPGRTFKRVITSKYFGAEDPEATKEYVTKAKQNKIDLLIEHEVVPKFLRYTFKDKEQKEVESVFVVFQNEEIDEQWNMVHVKEVSFYINASDFKEFEEMAFVSMEHDFKDLTELNEENYQGPERRKEKRESL